MPATDDATDAAARRRSLVEPVVVWALATTSAALLFRVSALGGWFHAIVAAIFLYVPAALLPAESLERFGLHARPLGRNLVLALVVSLVVLPLYLGGFVAWHALACRVPGLRPLVPGICEHARSLAHLRLPPDLLRFALAEVIVVALPEEFFFRGYVQSRLAAGLPTGRRGTAIAIVAASVLFALTHVAVQGNLGLLAVFFPSLVFGWLRARSGSVLPGTLFHALCNLYQETLWRSFLG